MLSKLKDLLLLFLMCFVCHVSMAQNTSGKVAGTEREIHLGNVVIKADRKWVKVDDNGGLIYNAKQIAKEHPVTSALDLLEEIPGIIKNDDELSVVGAGKTTVIINGHKSSMSVEDVKSLLAATPPSQVKTVEVFYNTPPQYGVTGSSINVVLEKKRSEKTSWNGSAYTSILQGRKYYQRGGVSINIFQKKWELGLGYALGNTNKYYQTDYDVRHTLDNQLIALNSHHGLASKNFAQQFKANFNYDFSKHDKLSLFYVVKFDNPEFHDKSYLVVDSQDGSEDVSNMNADKQTHTANIEFSHKNLTMGVDYVYFKNDKTQDLHKQGTTAYQLESEALQKVHKGNVYLNTSHHIGMGKLSYGFDASWSDVDNLYGNVWTEGTPFENDNNASQQQEYSVDGFVGWAQKFGKMGTLSANLLLQYYRADIKQDGEKENLWNDVYFFPSITYTHTLSKTQKLVFTLSSERKYPTFLQMSNNQTYMDTYIGNLGNPSLTPFITYESHLNYVLRNKFIFGLYAKIEPNDILQQLYQRSDRLQMNYENINMDYYNLFGMTAVMPFQWSSRFRTTFAANFYYKDVKGVLRDIPIKHSNWAGILNFSNTILLDKARTWSFQLSGVYWSKDRAALMRHEPKYTVNAALSWNPKKSGWSVVLKASDIFNSSITEFRVDESSQYVHYRTNKDLRIVNLYVRYNMKGYKQKKERTIDTSRMGL